MQKVKNSIILFVLTALFVLVGNPSPGVLASPEAVAPDLGSAASFVALGFSTLTNTGSGVFVGDVGSNGTGTSVTGFPPGSVINGSIYMGGVVADLARTDATTAYNNLDGQTCNVDLTGLNLGGKTLTPGVYCFDTSAQLTGALVLDALGNSNAVWVFQTGTTLTTAPGSSVTLINGSTPLNVFWQVGSSASLDTTTQFKGNILAYTSVSLNAGARLVGSAFGLNGAVTLDTNGSPSPIIANTTLYNFLYMPLINK